MISGRLSRCRNGVAGSAPKRKSVPKAKTLEQHRGRAGRSAAVCKSKALVPELQNTYALMLQSLTRFSISSGLTEDAAAAALEDLAARVRNGEPLAGDIPTYGGILASVTDAYSQWWSDVDYLDDGKPAPLPETGGPRSVRTLLSKHLSPKELATGLAMMRESDGIDRDDAGRLTPRTSAFISPPYKNVTLERVARVFEGYLSTIRLNNETEHAKGLLERTLMLTDIPKSFVPVFEKTARKQLGESLSSLHKFTKKSLNKPGERFHGEIGIHVFMYRVPGLHMPR